MNGYARSSATVFVSGDTITRGWQTVRDRYKKKYAGAQAMGRLEFSDLEITPLGADVAVALVAGNYFERAIIRTDDSPSFSGAPLEGWRIVHDHTS